MSPSSLLDDTLNLKYKDRDTGLGPTEQLYTARGAQGMGTYKEITDFGVSPENYDELAALLIAS